jgi:hypothetical protein
VTYQSCRDRCWNDRDEEDLQLGDKVNRFLRHALNVFAPMALALSRRDGRRPT